MASQIDADIAKIKKSPLFDPQWYLTQYPDVAATRIDPAAHFLKYGFAMGRDPGPDYSTVFYRRAHAIQTDAAPDPAIILRQLKSDTPPVPRPNRVLAAAADVARYGAHDRAIALAEHYLPDDLIHTVAVLRANAALSQGSPRIWARYVNEYLSHFDMAPIRLQGIGTVFDRLACDPLPAVTEGPLVSVLMPAWNAEDTVAKAARSILTQTWRNLELLIVDDCSTDGTWGVLQTLAAEDPRVRIFRNTVNAGPYVSKNIALSQAKGDWITGHDADDWAHPQRLERHLIEARGGDLPASLTYMIRVNPGGEFNHIGSTGKFSPDGVTRKASISTLFKRDFILNTLGYWDTVRFGADSEMIARATALLGDRFVSLPQIGMICLNLETSLTNHPDHGVDKVRGISPVRANYRQGWVDWHRDVMTPDAAYLPFPQKTRRYDADPAMVVPAETIAKNISQPA